jgi:hypothetical protein
MSIFTWSEENSSFLKNPTMGECKKKIGNAPYWTIHGRICYHDHPEPTYIIHHQIPVEAVDAKEWYTDFVHVYPDKKSLYAMTHYSLSELKEFAQKLEVSSEGKRKYIYESIQNEFKPFLTTTLNEL